jgi:dTDP-4-dehydrorhamnose reductase
MDNQTVQIRKALVIGSSGLLGQALVPYLQKKGFTVLTPTHTVLPVENYAAVLEFLKVHRPSVVINAAAAINVDAVEVDPYIAWQANTLGAAACARALAELQMQDTPYLYISTNYVFDDSRAIYCEADPVSPMNVYGETKAKGESLIATYCAKGSIPYYIARTSWLYGEHKNTFVDAMVAALQRGETVQAFSKHLGNLTAVSDFVRALIDELYLQQRPSGIYHLINEVADAAGGVSRYAVAAHVASVLGVDQARVQKNDQAVAFVAERPATAVLRNTKLPPLPLWDDALTAYLRAVYMV